MKLLFSIVLIFLFAKNVKAHEYYFAFAELEYNEFTDQIEGTLVVSAHDVSMIEGCKNRNEIHLNSDFKIYFHTHFQFIANQKSVDLELIGSKESTNGLLEIYFHSEKLNYPKEFTVKFYLLADIFPLQQNKITLSYRNQKITKHFINQDFTQEFNLEK